MAKKCLAMSVLLLLSVAAAADVLGADIRYVGTKDSAGRSISDVSHWTWNVLLRKYVDDNGRVDYKSWKATAEDLRLLDQYLDQLSAASRKVVATREARLAFWINAYNAVTIRGILNEYPTTSIRNHTARIWGYNIWKHLQLYVGGQPFSLDQIEHKILRKLSEPRIHFAIVCASIGCPRLLNAAYEAETLDDQLEANAKDFFSRRQNFQYLPNRRQFTVSAILEWFGEDFGSTPQARLQRIADWLPTSEARAAAKSNSVSLSYLDYDWNLNER